MDIKMINENEPDMHKKGYVCPELIVVRLALKEVILSSVEDLNSQIDDAGDWGDDPYIDSDGWLP